MLKKLIKYEWKSVWKICSIINIFAIAITLLSVFAVNLPFFKYAFRNSDFFQLLPLGLFVFYFISLLACCFSTYGYMAARFYKSMYTDEAYLTHTLPVTNRQVIVSKLLISSVWTFINTIIIFLSIIAITVSINLLANNGSLSQLLSELRENWLLVSEEFRLNPAILIILIIVYVLISIIHSMLMIYSSIALGQFLTRHRVVGALLFYFVEYSIIQILTMLIISVPLISFLAEINASSTPAIVMKQFMFPLLIGSAIATILISIIQFVITEYISKRRLNLE